MRRLRHEAARRLKSHRGSAALIGAARYLTAVLCAAAGVLSQRAVQALPQVQPWFPAAALLTAAAALTPLRIQSDWQIGRLTGTLDENDLGFLACSSSLRLWCKAIRLRVLVSVLLVISLLPACLLYAAARGVWLTAPLLTEGMLPVLTVLHLGFLAAVSLWLPLRVCAASAAVPFCCLKTPHHASAGILRAAFRLSRGQTAEIVLMRLRIAPLLLLPFPAIGLLPVLLAAEQIRFARTLRHQKPKDSSVYAGLELHAAGTL